MHPKSLHSITMQFSGSGQQNVPSNPVANFFRTNFNLCLTIFDTRRGQCEGEEHEKLLSFFPTTAPVHVRTSIVGLAQAVASFATTLTEVSDCTGLREGLTPGSPASPALHCASGESCMQQHTGEEHQSPTRHGIAGCCCCWTLKGFRHGDRAYPRALQQHGMGT